MGDETKVEQNLNFEGVAISTLLLLNYWTNGKSITLTSSLSKLLYVMLQTQSQQGKRLSLKCSVCQPQLSSKNLLFLQVTEAETYSAFCVMASIG